MKYGYNHEYKNLNLKNAITLSRPSLYPLTLFCFLVFNYASKHWSMPYILMWGVFSTFPYNLAVYWFDEWLEEKYGKGLWEVYQAPLYFMPPMVIGYMQLSTMFIGVYLFSLGWDMTHRVGHSEISFRHALTIPIKLFVSLLFLPKIQIFILFVCTYIILICVTLMVDLKGLNKRDYWITNFGVGYGGLIVIFLHIVTGGCL